MRTRAKTQSSPATKAGKRAASRRQPVPLAPPATRQPFPPAPRVPRQTRAPESLSVAVTTVRMLQVDEGLHALHIGAIGGDPSEIAGMAVPAAQVSAPFAEDGEAVEIVASYPRRGPWLDQEGGTVILRSPRDGGQVIVTVYGDPAQQTDEPSLDLQCLDAPVATVEQAAPTVARPAGAVPRPAPEARPAGAATRAAPEARPTGASARVAPEARDVPTEILLHIERTGDRLFPGRGWVGALGRQMRIEAFSIRPLEGLAPSDIEMKAFLPDGDETPWVPGDVFCGTRGQGLPLLGFAIRVVPQRADRFEVVYQGSFFTGGISQMHQNGAQCRSGTADDPLEAINVRVIEHVDEPMGTAIAE